MFPSDSIVECQDIATTILLQAVLLVLSSARQVQPPCIFHPIPSFLVPPCQPALAHLHRIGMNLMRRQRISKPMTTGAPLSLSRLSRMQAAIQTIRENAILTGSAHSPPSLHPFPNSTSAYRRLPPETITLNYQTLENGTRQGFIKV